MEVKRIFFTPGSNLPYYELSNGDIKKPRLNLYGGVRWYTDEEFLEYKKKEEEIIKSHSFKNQVKKFFKSIFNGD
jgi:hypothetical protein